MNISINKDYLVKVLEKRIRIAAGTLAMNNRIGFGGSLPDVELNLIIDKLLLAALTDAHSFIEMVGDEE